MANLVLPLHEQEKRVMDNFSWINWSELARKEIIKKLIFEDYMKNGEVSDEDWKFCEANDWHPCDWLPLKPEYIKKAKKIMKQKGKRYNSVNDFFAKLK